MNAGFEEYENVDTKSHDSRNLSFGAARDVKLFQMHLRALVAHSTSRGNSPARSRPEAAAALSYEKQVFIS